MAYRGSPTRRHERIFFIGMSLVAVGVLLVLPSFTLDMITDAGLHHAPSNGVSEGGGSYGGEGGSLAATISAVTGLVTATAGLVTAIAGLILSWRRPAAAPRPDESSA